MPSSWPKSGDLPRRLEWGFTLECSVWACRSSCQIEVERSLALQIGACFALKLSAVSYA